MKLTRSDKILLHPYFTVGMFVLIGAMVVFELYIWPGVK